MLILFKLKGGIPNDPRFPERRDEFVQNQTKEQGLIVQWLDDFRSRFDTFEDAQAIIKQVEEALVLYNDVIGIYSTFIFF